jgi:hypothetical protein
MRGTSTQSVFGASCGTSLERVSLGNQSGRVSREESVLKTQSWESVISSLKRVLEKPALGKPELGGSS